MGGDGVPQVQAQDRRQDCGRVMLEGEVLVRRICLKGGNAWMFAKGDLRVTLGHQTFCVVLVTSDVIALS